MAGTGTQALITAQSNIVQTATPTAGTSTTLAVITGQAIFVGLGEVLQGVGSLTTPTLSDGVNTYVQVKALGVAFSSGSLLYAATASTTTTVTITASMTAGTELTLAAIAVSNVTSITADGTASNSNAGSTTISAGSVSVSQAGDFGVGFFQTRYTSNSLAINGSVSESLVACGQDVLNFNGMFIFYADSSFNPTFKIGVSTAWSCVAASFKAAQPSFGGTVHMRSGNLSPLGR